MKRRLMNKKMVLGFFKRIYFFIENYFVRFKQKKDVLFVVKHRIMFNYAWAICELLDKDPRIRLWVCFTEQGRFGIKELKETVKAHRIRIMPQKLAKFVKWDLIVYPDHGTYFRKDCKKIFTGHGLASGKKISQDHYLFGSRSFYADEDRIIYDKILVPSEYVRLKVKELYPRFYPSIRVVGCLFIDKVVGIREMRSDLLRKMKLDPSRKTVMVTSTWGPHAFAEKQGTEFIKKIPEITKKYNLIISFHVINFEKKYAARHDWKELLDKIDSDNVFVLEPGTDPFQILPQADLLVADITSLALYYTPLGRPIIYFDIPTMAYETLSLARELRSIAYLIQDVSNLETDIDKAFKNFDKNQMLELSSKVASYRGQSSTRYLQEIYDSLDLEAYQDTTEPRPI